jgi:hypothetical protein
MTTVSLSPAEARAIRGVLEEIPALQSLLSLLARHRDDPDARRLSRALFAKLGPQTTSREKILLAAGDAGEESGSAQTGSVKQDSSGHHFIDEGKGHQHCDDCRSKLLAAGDPTIGREGQFIDSFRHRMAQSYVLIYGKRYREAVEMVDREAAAEGTAL